MVWKTNFKPVESCSQLDETITPSAASSQSKQDPLEVTISVSPDQSEDEREREEEEEVTTVKTNTRSEKGETKTQQVSILRTTRNGMQIYTVQYILNVRYVIIVRRSSCHATNCMGGLTFLFNFS